MEAPMVWVSVLAAACLCVVSAAMISASASDLLSRMVDDRHWRLVMAVGIPCSAIVSAAEVSASSAALMALSSAFMAAHALSERVPGHVSLAASGLLCIASYASAAGDPRGWTLLAPFASSALFLAMYHARLLAGGADAKALIAVSMVPQYPCVPGLPLVWDAGWPLSVLPLSVSALVLAVILSLVPMVFLGFRNAATGFRCARMFTEYRMPLERARTSFVWLAEDVEGGVVVHRRVMDDEAGAYSRLEDAGMAEVSVTPMVPFVVFITAGMLVALVLGNPLFAAM